MQVHNWGEGDSGFSVSQMAPLEPLPISSELKVLIELVNEMIHRRELPPVWYGQVSN